MNKDQSNFFRYIWLLLCMSPFIVGIIVSVRVVNITTSNDWIGFYGAIIGGLITFLGIYLSTKGVRSQLALHEDMNTLMKIQLQNEKVKIEEERRLNVRPYINEYHGNSNYSIKKLSVIFENHEVEAHAYQDDLIIIVKNIGLGPIISLRVIGLIEVGSDLYSSFHDEYKSLEKDGVMELTISYIHNKRYSSNTYQIILEYFDILEYLYTQTITIVAIKEGDRLKKVLFNGISKQELVERT